MPPSPSTFDVADGAGHPLWRERAFVLTLLGSGALAALPPIVASRAPGVWPAAALVLLALLATAYLGGAAPPGDVRLAALRSLRFALGAAALPLFAGLVAAALGLGPGGWVALVLLGAGALLALAAIAPLEVAPPPDAADERGEAGAPMLLAGAAFSFAIAPLTESPIAGAVQRVGDPSGIGAWLIACFAFALGWGALVAGAGLVGGSLLRQLRYRSFRAPRAAAAALLLAVSGGIAAVGLTWSH
jgi:hypothetical protein